MDRRSGRPSARRILGDWYIASFVITFGGGAALAAAIFVTTPAKAYAWGMARRARLDSQAAAPGFFAAIVLFDLLVGDRAPAGFTGWLIACAALALGMMAAGILRHQRPSALPPGDYGTPIRPLLDTTR